MLLQDKNTNAATMASHGRILTDAIFLKIDFIFGIFHDDSDEVKIDLNSNP